MSTARSRVVLRPSAHVERHGPPYLAAHEHVICTGLDHLRAELARIEALGGEGLMLRQPESRYEVGRSLTLLKVKNFRDAEARVLEHLKGAGRHKGRLGALLVELADGTRFSVGTGFSDAEREAPPPVGSVITFRYQELSDGGVPRFPSFVRMRGDAVGPTTPTTTPPADAKAPAPGPNALGTVASGPAVRVDRGIVEQVLGSGPRRLRGDRATAGSEAMAKPRPRNSQAKSWPSATPTD